MLCCVAYRTIVTCTCLTKCVQARLTGESVYCCQARLLHALTHSAQLCGIRRMLQYTSAALLLLSCTKDAISASAVGAFCASSNSCSLAWQTSGMQRWYAAVFPGCTDDESLALSVQLQRMSQVAMRAFCRLWFVRMPKPLEETASVASEHELESFKTQVAILNESLNVKRVRWTCFVPVVVVDGMAAHVRHNGFN